MSVKRKADEREETVLDNTTQITAKKKKLTAEVWVSSRGRLKSQYGVIVCGTKKKDGYMATRVSGWNYFVHELVLRAFKGPPPTLDHTVDHINHDRSHNWIENLRWASKSEQMVHAWEKAGRKKRHYSSDRPVVATCITSLDEQGECRKVNFSSVRLAASELGLSTRMILKCCRSAQKVAAGLYRFEYKPDQDLTDEIWHEIGNSDRYISNMGRFKEKFGRITQGSLHKSGYLSVWVESKMHSVHILVAMSFLGSPPTPLHTVDHIDGNTQNNSAENLRWATRSEQRINQRGGETRGTAISKPVRIRKVGETQWQSYPSTTEVGRVLQISHTCVVQVCRGIHKTVAGYEAQYEDVPDLPDEKWVKITVPF